jgi:hypothetical protein
MANHPTDTKLLAETRQLLAENDRLNPFVENLITRLADRLQALSETGGWLPIEGAIEAAKADDGWIPSCLFGKRQSWGWEVWVGQCDNGDIWLGRDGAGACWECEIPTHYMPLPPAPGEGSLQKMQTTPGEDSSLQKMQIAPGEGE